MDNYFFQFLFILKNLRLTNREKKFISSSKNIENTDSNKKIIINGSLIDSFFLGIVFFLIKINCFNKNNSVFLSGDFFIDYNKRSKFSLFRLIKKVYFYLLIKKKKYIYQNFVDKFYLLTSLIKPYKKKEFKHKSNVIFLKIKNKNNLLKLKLSKILVGDLIYDTYLRTTNESTVDIKNSRIIKQLIFYTLCLIEACKFFNNCKFDYFLTRYTTYIQHGVPTRFFLSRGIKVISAGETALGLKIHTNKKDFYVSNNYEDYRNLFKKIKEKKKLLKLAKKNINKLFLDKSYKYHYIKNNNKSIKFNDSNFKGIIFLNCLLDAPHCYGNLLFSDFYEWIRFTLDFFKKNDYSKSIIIKPHPNMVEESMILVKDLMNTYSDFRWISKDTSNKDIFKMRPSFGISSYGSVLWELAYHKILPIAAGRHPSIAYDFVKTPNSIKDYKILLSNCINGNLNYKVDKKQLYEWFYIHYLFNDVQGQSTEHSNNFNNFKFLEKKNNYYYTNLFRNKYSNIID